jgi:HEAT repeats
MHVIRYCAVCLFLLLSNSLAVNAQVDVTNQHVPMQVSLKPDKKTIMLGEPLFFSVEVTNLSAEKLCIGVGADYRNRFGRPNSFDVAVRRSDDDSELPQFEVFNFGGISGCDPIESGETYVFRLFLAHWANIERTGSYRINVKRTMSLSTYDRSAGSPKYSMKANLNSEFVVVAADENRMGGVISSLGSTMLDSSDPGAIDSAEALASIHDKRVISYFAEAVRKFGDFGYDDPFSREPSITLKSIAALGDYDDDSAIEALHGAMDSPVDFTRVALAAALNDSPHRSAIKLLLKMQNDKDSSVRASVAYGLSKLATEESRAALQKLLKDENEDVRNAAKESLDKINQPARPN